MNYNQVNRNLIISLVSTEEITYKITILKIKQTRNQILKDLED